MKKDKIMTKDRWLISAVALSLAISGYTAIQNRSARTSMEAEMREMLNTVNARIEVLTDVEARVETLAKRLDESGDRPQEALAELATSVRTPRTAGRRNGKPAAHKAAPATGSNDHTVQLEEAIAERVEAKIGERMEKIANRERNERGEWEAPIAELAAELALDDHQQDTVTAIFDKARDDIFALLHTLRDDGGSLVDDFAADLKSGMAIDKATQTFIQGMFNDLVPGTDHTYLSDMVALRAEVLEALDEELDMKQMNKLELLHIDPLNINTGYDPIREYIEDKFRE